MRKIVIAILIIVIIILITMLDNDKKTKEGVTQEFAQGKTLEIGQQLKYPLDQTSKQILKEAMKEFLAEQILDSEWKNAIRVFLSFESVEGYTKVGTITIGGDNVVITTGAVSADWAALTKSPLNQALFSFSMKSYFRTNFQLTSVVAQTIYIRVGTDGKQGYGFKIVNGTLYGFTHDGTTESTIQLQTGLATVNTYSIEARYLPRNKVVFWVDDPGTTPKILIRQVGVLTANLPLVDNTVNQDALMRIKITTDATGAKSIKLSFFEYIQDNRWKTNY